MNTRNNHHQRRLRLPSRLTIAGDGILGGKTNKHPRRSLGQVLAICLTLLWSGVSLAQEETQKRVGRVVLTGADPTDDLDDLGLLDLEVPIVVTASRREQKLSAVPYAMSVITAEDIRRSGARNVPDALRLVPGMDVADLSSGSSAVAPRGFHGFLARQVLVLVDGRQIFDSHFGGTLWGSWPFQLEDIERIEVIRGPGGVTWGANAVNGVINVITKDPSDQLGLTLSTSGGSRGSFKQHVGYGVQDGKVRLRLSGEYESNDGFRKGGSIFQSLDDDYKVGRINLHAVYELDPRETFTLSLGSAVVNGAYPRSPIGGPGMGRASGSQASFIMGTWTKEVSDVETYNVSAYINDFQASPGLKQIDYRYQQIALLFSHTYEVEDDRKRTWGIDTRVDLLDATNAEPFMLEEGSVSTAVVGAYVQDSWELSPKWTLDLGGRIDYESYGGFQPSARGALSYRLGDHGMIYGAISRAFQMPPVGLRFINTPMLSGLTHATGNRSLDPEILIAYEIGYHGKPSDRLNLGMHLFWNEYSDLTTLSPSVGLPELITMNVDNRGDASIYGAEIDVKFAATKKLILSAHYTYQRMDWRSSRPFHEKELITPPHNKFMMGARYDVTDDLHLSGNLFYVDSVRAPTPSNPFVYRKIDSYIRLDLRAEYEFDNDRASLAIGVRNLLDPDHPEGGTLFLNEAEVPRMIYAEMRFQIQ